MKTTYEKTNYAHITPDVKALYQARSKRVGHEIVPLAHGESEPLQTPSGLTAFDTGSGYVPGEPKTAELVNINTAAIDDLASLPSLNYDLAATIADHIEVSGPFESIDDLSELDGIGKKTVEKLRELVTV